MNENIKNLLDKGIANNVVVWDDYAKSGEVTTRLYLQMSAELFRICKEPCLVVIKDETGEMKKYLEEAGGDLPPKRDRLIMMISETNVLLGAY